MEGPRRPPTYVQKIGGVVQAPTQACALIKGMTGCWIRTGQLRPSSRRNMSRSEGNARRSVTLHMVSSLDGYIAKKDNSVSWLESTGSVYERGVSISDEEITKFLKTIDCYVMGSRTYQHALELGWPYGDTPVVVVSSRQWPPAKKSVEFYSGDLKPLVDVKLAARYRNIWLVGGAKLCHDFLELGLVDEVKLTIAPVLLGEGLRLFGDSRTEKKWNLEDVVAYKNGFVELSYSAAPHKALQNH